MRELLRDRITRWALVVAVAAAAVLLLLLVLMWLPGEQAEQLDYTPIQLEDVPKHPLEQQEKPEGCQRIWIEERHIGLPTCTGGCHKRNDALVQRAGPG